MDPSIMKLLEEDEDETMHSGADVDAFTAALNRDIEGDTTSTSQPPTATDAGNALSQATNHTPSQLFQQWQSSNREGNTNFSNEQESKPHVQQEQQQPSAMEVNRHGSAPESQHPPNDTSSQPNHVPSEPSRPQDDQHSSVHTSSQTMNMQNTDKNPGHRQEPNASRNPENESQLQRMQRMSTQQQQQQQQQQQAMASGQAAANAINRQPGKQVPFALLLPVIEPQLDKDRAMQLQGLYVRLRNNNINKEEFVRHMRSLVGDHMLKMAVYKLQQGQLTAKQNIQKPSPYAPSSSDATSLPMDQKSRLMEQQQQQQQQQSDSSHGVTSASHMSVASNLATIKQDREQPPFPMQNLKQQQQHNMHFPQSSFPNYGNTPGNFNPIMNIPSQSFKQQSHDLQMRQGPVHQMSLPERQNAFNEMKRMHGAHFTGQHEQANTAASASKDESLDMMASRPGFSTPSKPEPMSITAQLERQNAERQNAAAANSSLASGSNLKTPPKKPTVGQKKPLETPASSLSKKQKVSGAYSDQSIEQLNDVTAVSGVNLREEEEQLFSGSKEDSRVSEASRKVVQEEEERLILQKIPLQKKLAEIMAKCGVKNRGNDVERCLSLCVEERMRGLISNLIRLSKQRVDIEKPRHRTVITSDVGQQIMSMNQKAREEWEKKQADAEKLQRADEPEGSGDGEDGRGKSSKVNKEEDDKMRTTAANVAARAAVGGDDMLSKWTLMAEQARQKQNTQPSGDAAPKPVERSSKDNPDTDRASAAAAGAATTTPGPVRKSLRNQETPQSSTIARTISVKDVISVLGREIQMSRSTLIYRLYEKVRSDSASE